MADVYVSVSDSATGQDSLSITQIVQIQDSAQGSEQITEIKAYLSLQDQGQGIDIPPEVYTGIVVRAPFIIYDDDMPIRKINQISRWFLIASGFNISKGTVVSLVEEGEADAGKVKTPWKPGFNKIYPSGGVE